MHNTHILTVTFYYCITPPIVYSYLYIFIFYPAHSVFIVLISIYISYCTDPIYLHFHFNMHITLHFYCLSFLHFWLDAKLHFVVYVLVLCNDNKVESNLI